MHLAGLTTQGNFIQVVTPARTYLLLAQDPAERLAWMRAIREVVADWAIVHMP